MASTSHVSETVAPTDPDDSDFETMLPPRALPLPDPSLIQYTQDKQEVSRSHSTVARQLMGTVTPDNTTRTTRCALRLLCHFIAGNVDEFIDDPLEYGRLTLFPSEKKGSLCQMAFQIGPPTTLRLSATT